MIATREQQKAKALELMRSLRVAELFIKLTDNSQEFMRDFFSKAYEDPSLKERIETLEKEKGIFIYYVTKERMSFGECYSFLYVSSYLEDFSRQDIREGRTGEKLVYAWVDNIHHPEFSEYGSIAVKNDKGFLVRTA